MLLLFLTLAASDMWSQKGDGNSNFPAIIKSKSSSWLSVGLENTHKYIVTHSLELLIFEIKTQNVLTKSKHLTGPIDYDYSPEDRRRSQFAGRCLPAVAYQHV